MTDVIQGKRVGNRSGLVTTFTKKKKKKVQENFNEIIIIK